MDARGSSALMVKETQSHALLQFLQLVQAPGLAPYVKIPAALRKWVETMRLSTDELIKTDQEIKASAGAGAPDPQSQAAAQAQATREAQAAQQAQMDTQAQNLKYRMHQEALASKERIAAAEIEDRQQGRALEVQKARLEDEQFRLEAALKQALGSGV